MVAVDDVFDLLSDQRRRYALYYLDEQADPVPIEDVVAAVADMERGAEMQEIPPDMRTDIEVSLHHTHLQKADEYDFIRYDSEAGVVELVESPLKFDMVLTVASVLERSD